MTKHLKIALAQLNPVVGDLAGNAAKLRKARAEAAAAGADLVVFPELFITGYPPEDLVRKPAFAAAARAARRGAGGRDRRRRPRRDRRHHLGRGRQALQLGGAARRRPHRGRAPQGRPAQLRRVRREARVRPGADAGPGQLPRRAHRRADLRGHLEGRGVRVPAGDGLGDADRRPTARRSTGPSPTAHERGRGARDGDGAAAALPQPGGRPGRAGVRRRLLRAQRGRRPRRAAAGLGGGASASSRCGARGRAGAASRPSAPCSRSARRPPTTPACWACGTTSTRTASPASCMGLSGGIDFRAGRGAWRWMRWARSACTA